MSLFSKARLITTAAIGGACLVAKKLSNQNESFGFFNLNQVKTCYADANLLNSENIDCDPVIFGKKEVEYPLWEHNWDKRARKEDDEKPLEKSCRTLLLIRHGDYHTSRDHEKYGHLNEKGVQQAQSAGVRLKELIENGLEIDAFIVSTMPRAQESFEAIKENVDTSCMEVVSSDIITEGYPCVPDPPSSSKRTESQVFQDSVRFEAGFRKLFYRPSGDHGNTYNVVVCHANLIRFLVMRALQLPEKAWLRFSLQNASFTEVRVYEDGKVSLVNFGEQAHVKWSCE